MKALRISASIFALTSLSLLAACGGGGGGGGGGTPPTSAPTGHPTSTPAPTPTPTATATSSGNVAVNAGLTVSAEENFINGARGWYTSGTASWSNNAGDTSNTTAPQTLNGTFEGMTCADTVEGTSFPSTAYSQHAFVGLYNSSGQEVSLPQALGMVNPVAPTAGTPSHPSNTYEVENYTCEYNMHTHDYSGLVHFEDVNAPQNTSYTYAPSWANLQTLLDEWGASLNTSTGLTAGGSTLNGAVSIYVGTPSKTVNGVDYVTSYTKYTGALNALALTRHSAVWIVVGTTAANIPVQQGSTGQNPGLPQVKFVISN